MKGRLLAFIPLALLLVVVAFAIVALTAGPRPDKFAGAEHRPVPAFSLQRLGGEGAIANENFAGRPYVINMFASWCVPCQAENPYLMALKAEGVEIFGIAYKNRPEEAAAFLRGLGDPYAEVALDPAGRFGLELGIEGKVPETIVVDAEGRIVLFVRGPLSQDAAQNLVLPAYRRLKGS